ncbi:hypothetical protein DFS34DRAFT_592402 [Phlyctochytrium arcticum]|nr:hypothetical protein DFS34DRAFT_592402 [Phlyctochytrium arcticum]
MDSTVMVHDGHLQRGIRTQLFYLWVHLPQAAKCNAILKKLVCQDQLRTIFAFCAFDGDLKSLIVSESEAGTDATDSDGSNDSSDPSENHVKAELWTPILSNAIKHMDFSGIGSMWEVQHLFPGNAGTGSAKSDFASILVAENGAYFPLLITELDVDGLSIHKDHLVVVSEAVFELSQILERRTWDFMALVNNARISFKKLVPKLDENCLYYVETNTLMAFDLDSTDEKTLV